MTAPVIVDGAALGDGGDAEPVRSPNGHAVPPPPPPTTPPVGPAARPAHLRAGAEWIGRQAGRPRVRAGLLGALLLAVALLWVDGTWRTVLGVAGFVLMLVAYVGSRMRGHLSLDWGEHGTRIAFEAGITPAAEPVRPQLVAASSPAPDVTATPPIEVIEGEAHTVEIDVGELKTLIAAAERAEAHRRDAA